MGDYEANYGSRYSVVNHGGTIGYYMGAFCERLSDIHQKYINNDYPTYRIDNCQYLFLSTRREIKVQK